MILAPASGVITSVEVPAFVNGNIWVTVEKNAKNEAVAFLKTTGSVAVSGSTSGSSVPDSSTADSSNGTGSSCDESGTILTSVASICIGVSEGTSVSSC